MSNPLQQTIEALAKDLARASDVLTLRNLIGNPSAPAFRSSARAASGSVRKPG